MKYVVRASELNLRSSPRVVSTNRIGLLPRGHEVDLLEKAAAPWWKIRTRLDGTPVEGYVSSAYLVAGPEKAPPEAVAKKLVEVHLQTSQPVTRGRDGGRAFALNEAGAPRRDARTPAARAAQLLEIVHWLRVDRSARYLRKGSSTFCNIYSYDYCFLAGAYLPRVWWTATAISALNSGRSVAVVYDQTVRELNANSLHDWLPEFGPQFGWRREFDLDALQAAANAGAVCLVSGKNANSESPGHICPVVPEKGTRQADRRNGRVHAPLQSNAGRENFQFGTPRWWTSATFRSTSFWIHD